MRQGRFFIKCISFFVIAMAAASLVNMVLNPKYLYDETWPTTQTFLDFYEMDKDSLDVLFIGSSKAVSAFSPLELYDVHGINSYNLGSGQQNMLVSYYWLQEALRYQEPKVVVLDTRMLFEYNSEEILNSSEASIRKAIDYMRWSPNKIRAIRDICDEDEKQSISSYLLINVRYHDRWKELEKKDFYFPERGKGLLGYSLQGTTVAQLDPEAAWQYEPFTVNENAGQPAYSMVMVNYMNALVTLCKEKGIEVILTNTPSNSIHDSHYNYVKAYAEEHDLRYINFNEESVYREIGYEYSVDNSDPVHVNYRGMQKICNYMADILINDYGIESRPNPQMEERLPAYYEERKQKVELSVEG